MPSRQTAYSRHRHKRMTRHIPWRRQPECPSIRPGEMLAIKEQDIDLERGVIIIPNPKEGRPKIVPLLEEDVELARQAMADFPGFSGMHFFRSCKAEEGIAPDVPFHGKRLYKWWKKACANLGVEGVDLYGGTKHSTATALRDKGLSPEEIKKATMHQTNEAFDRYFQKDPNALREIYAKAKKGNAVAFKRVEGED